MRKQADAGRKAGGLEGEDKLESWKDEIAVSNSQLSTISLTVILEEVRRRI